MLHHKRKLRSLVIVIGLSSVLSACGVAGLFDTRPYYDQETNSSGNLVFSDNQRNFERWKSLTDISIDREAKGFAAPRAVGTWKARWKRNIAGMRKHRANPEKYVNYIITTRRALGLPEL